MSQSCPNGLNKLRPLLRVGPRRSILRSDRLGNAHLSLRREGTFSESFQRTAHQRLKCRILPSSPCAIRYRFAQLGMIAIECAQRLDSTLFAFRGVVSPQTVFALQPLPVCLAGF